MIKSKALSFEDKLLDLEEQKRILEDKVLEYEQRVKYKSVTPGTYKKSFKEAKKRLAKGSLSATKMLIARYIEEVIISPDGVKIIFRSSLDDLSIEKEASQDRTDYSASPTMLLHGGTRKTNTKNVSLVQNRCTGNPSK